MADETIGRATVQLGVDGSKLAPEMSAAMAKAQGALDRATKQMERAHASTMKAIQGHIDRINATKPTHEMRLLEQAVAKLGGTSRLSVDQLGRVTAEVNRLAAAGAKVPASLAGLTAGTSKLSAAFTSLTTGGGISGALAAIGPAGVAAAGALGAVTVAGGAAFRAIADLAGQAEQWSNLAASTGLGVEEVQQLSILLQDAGIPAEALARGMKELQQEIATGGKELEKFGIDVSKLKDLTPEEQLREMAAQIAAIEDPAVRTAVALAAFGKSGTDLIPVLDQVASGADKMFDVLSGDQVAALADADAKIDGFTRKLSFYSKSLLATAVEMAQSFRGFAGVVPIFIPDPPAGAGGGAAATDPARQQAERERQRKAAEYAAREAEKKAREATRKAEAEAKKTAEDRLKLDRERNAVLVSIVKTTNEEATALRELADLSTKLLETQQEIESARMAALKETRLRGGDMLPSVGGAGLWTRYQDVLDQELENAAEQTKKVVEETKDWSATLGDLATQLQTLASTTGGVAGKILNLAASISSGLGGVLNGLKGLSGGGLLQKLSAGAGLIGSAVGLVGGVISGVKGLFGRGKQREQVTQGREQFIQSFGGLEELQRRAAAAGVSLERLMKAKDSVKGFEAAVKEVTDGIEKYERKIAGLTTAREASESLLERLDKGGLSEGLTSALQELIGRVQGALAQSGLGLLKTGPLRDSEAFAEQEGIAADLAKLIAGMREAGIVDEGSLAAGGAAAKELQTAAVAAATEAGLPATEATKAGFAAIAPVLREQLNAALQSGRELDANTKALLEEAKANGIEIMADPMVQSLAVQREQLGVLRSIAGQGRGGPEPGDVPGGGAIPAAGGLGPMITPNLGGGLGPLIQTHPGELAMVIPRSKMGPGGLISADSGLYARTEVRGGRGGRQTTVNLSIAENPFASAEGAARLRRYTLRAAKREAARHLAALVASGRA